MAFPVLFVNSSSKDRVDVYGGSQVNELIYFIQRFTTYFYHWWWVCPLSCYLSFLDADCQLEEIARFARRSHCTLLWQQKLLKWIFMAVWLMLWIWAIKCYTGVTCMCPCLLDLQIEQTTEVKVHYFHGLGKKKAVKLASFHPFKVGRMIFCGSLAYTANLGSSWCIGIISMLLRFFLTLRHSVCQPS